MSGIVFLGTKKLETIQNFYLSKVGAKVWLDQGDCIILSHGNMLLGFCKRKKKDTCGIITFFYRSKEEVDHMYENTKEYALGEPKVNEKYQIYHFFAEDPEGRTIEFQHFLHEIPELSSS